MNFKQLHEEKNYSENDCMTNDVPCSNPNTLDDEQYRIYRHVYDDCMIVSSSGRDTNLKRKERKKRSRKREKCVEEARITDDVFYQYTGDIPYDYLHEQHSYEIEKLPNYTMLGTIVKSLPKYALAIFIISSFLYLVMYNQASRENDNCVKNCSNLLKNNTAISSLARYATAVDSAPLHAKKTPSLDYHNHRFFEKLLSSSNKDYVPGWSYNTSRDTRMYILPDNVTLLNQPRSMLGYKSKGSPSKNKKNEDIFLLVIICSKIDNFKARSAIRDTWGNELNYAKLSYIFQNITIHFENVNVSDISNYKRTKRDLTDRLLDLYSSFDDDFHSDNYLNPETLSESNVHNENFKYTISNSNTLKRRRKRREFPLSENSAKDETNNIPDDPRFDNSIVETTPTESVDSKILGNFEEDENKILDYYDYATEPSNIMRIPPKGEKYAVDDSILKSIAELQFNEENPSKTDSSKTPTVAKDLHNVKSVKNNNFTTAFKPPVKVKFLFLLGQSANENNTELQSKIDEESILHDDIIQEGFVDSYNNLTLKSIMLLKWVVNNYKNKVHYIMKTDDDMFINIPRLVDALQNKTNEHLIKTLKLDVKNNRDVNGVLKNITNINRKVILNSEKLLMGDLICEAKPIADISNKWHSPKYMYGGKVYPRYLSGTGYVMSFPAAESLYKAALDTPIFHLEDIYITGMCSEKAGIKPIDHPGFSYSIPKFDPCTFAYLITAHQVSPYKLRRMHRLLTISSFRLLESCEIRRLTTKKMTTSPIKAMSNPKSFLDGLMGSGLFDWEHSKLGLLSGKKRKRPNNCH